MQTFNFGRQKLDLLNPLLPDLRALALWQVQCGVNGCDDDTVDEAILLDAEERARRCFYSSRFEGREDSLCGALGAISRRANDPIVVKDI